MQGPRDHRIRDLGRTVLVLRSDLVFLPRTEGGETGYLIEDPVNSKFYRVGLAEYTFISFLDGQTSISAALAQTARALPEEALSEQDGAGVCKWLIETELARTTESTAAGRLVAAARQGQGERLLAKLNPIFLRLPLWHPDRFFTRMLPWLGWLQSRGALVAALLLGLAACYQVTSQWDRFSAASVGIFSPDRWLWLGLCWVLLKIVHETAHGVACKKYGGAVHEAGLIMILLAPLAYVDVTSSWRFRSKWQRMHVAAAGMAVELVVASIAALVWSVSGPGLTADVAFNLVVMASLTTLIFNANPLMRFDGYYLLSDGLEIPNLYSSGQQYVKHVGRRWLLGVPSRLPEWTPRRGRFIKVYGVAALVWKVFICLMLTMAASTLLHGAGIVLAALAVVVWLGLPAFRFAQYLLGMGESNQGAVPPNRVRLLAASVAIVVGGGLLLAVVPSPGARRAPAIVQYEPLAVVRSASAGFVREVRVTSGQRVAEGEVLALLENGQLRQELADLELAIAQSEVSSRSLHQQDELAAYQAELKNTRSLRQQSDEKWSQVEGLVVRAPHAGRVLNRNPRQLLGRYLEEGTEVVSIGDERRKELQLAIAQEDVDAFAAHLGAAVQVRLPGGGRLKCRLEKVNPQATLTPSHRALCAPEGGPLIVRSRESAESEEETPYELLTPRLLGTVGLTAEQSSALRVGQRGTVWFGRGGEPIGRTLYRLLKNGIPESFARQFHVAP